MNAVYELIPRKNFQVRRTIMLIDNLAWAKEESCFGWTREIGFL